MATAYLATLDTRHFSFAVLDASEELARMAVMAAWARHATQTGADIGYVTPSDVDVRGYEFGVAYRDGRAI